SKNHMIYSLKVRTSKYKMQIGLAVQHVLSEGIQIEHLIDTAMKKMRTFKCLIQCQEQRAPGNHDSFAAGYDDTCMVPSLVAPAIKGLNIFRWLASQCA